MVFLIEYARTEGRVVEIREYRDDERLIAENVRLDLELELNRQGIDHEIVLLDAANKEALRLTHSRYFPVSEWPEPEIEWPDGDLPDQAVDPPDS
jgi:hypothetical protein